MPPLASPASGAFDLTALVPTEAQLAATRALDGIDRTILGLAVVDAPTHARMGELVLAERGLRDTVANIIKPYKTEAHNRHRAITAFENELLGKLLEADRHGVGQMRAWEDAEAAARKAEEARLAALAAEATRIVESKVVETAANLEAAGRGEEAAALVETAAAPKMPFAPTPTSGRPVATPGLKPVTVWSAVQETRPGALLDLVKAIAAGTVPVDAIEPNMTYMNGRARKQKAKGPLTTADGQIVPGFVVQGTDDYRRAPGAGRDPEAGM